MHPRTIKLAADGALELIIYGDIGMDFFGDGVSAGRVVDILSAHRDAPAITVRINSPGGSAFDGVAIYNVLKQHPAAVTVHVDGVAASSASIIAMAGDTIHMASGSLMMIHDAGVSHMSGGAEDLRKAADLIEKLTGQMADIYAGRGNRGASHYLELMAEETWFSAAEAIALGLADDVDADAPAMAAHFDPATYGYRNAPASLVASAEEQVRFTSDAAGWSLPGGTSTNYPPANAAGSEQPEAPHARGDHRMKILANLLGLSLEASEEALADVVRKTQARADSGDEYRASVESLTGAEGDAALGVIKAKLEAADQLPALQAKLADIEAAADADKRKSLIESGKSDGKLTAALEKHFSDRSTAELEAFLKVAPKVVPVNEGVTQPRAAGAGADDGEAAPTHEGKTYEALTGPEKVALKASNPELFAQMRAHFNASH